MVPKRKWPWSATIKSDGIMAIKPRVEEAKSRGSCARRICGEVGEPG